MTYLDDLKNGTLLAQEREHFVCNRCNSNYTSDDITWDDTEELCATCRTNDELGEWYNNTTDQLLAAADELGWDLEKESYAQTCSRYFSFTKEVNNEWIDFKVRIADHGECYCNEDMSIDPNGNTLEQVISKLKSIK